jgi:hypothetical protein
VVLAYEAEGRGPFLVDLSHLCKWDLQESSPSKIQPWEIPVPGTPGKCVFRNGLLVSRMNPAQAVVWQMNGASPQSPPDAAYTDVTEAYALMALLGQEAFAIMERITPLDLSDPKKALPFLIQGPVLGVASQVVVVSREGARSGVLISCSRGYGQRVSEAILDAGREWGLRAAGQAKADEWVQRLSDLASGR